MLFLLRLKSWQLFILFMFTMGNFWIVPVNFFSGCICIGWIYAIGVKMHELMPDSIKPSVRYFKISCVGAVLLSFVWLFVMPYFVSLYIGAEAIYLLMVVLVSIFIYITAFASRMLESMIEGELVSLSDAAKCLFCFWFFPFGVWFIQPAVQRVLNQYQAKQANEGLAT